MSSSIQTSRDLVNQPADTALKQQRIKAWNPILDPLYVIVGLFIIGVAFVPTGIEIVKMSNQVVEITKTYDSFYEEKIDSTLDCSIEGFNENKSCTIEFEIEEDMEGPILVYYEIENFYQNHREYTTSRDDAQLLGVETQTSLAAKKCEPMNVIGNVTINPCGLVANTFFNDIIKLQSNSVDVEGNAVKLIEEGIAWQSDLDYKFSQPESFKVYACTSCESEDCVCTDEWSCEEKYQDPVTKKCYLYHYENEETTQYLYETYPDIISPIEGVTNEHFVVWMRLAAKSKFRKLYGFLDQSIKAGSKVKFDVKANWNVKSFKGTKSLILSTSSIFGGKNPYLGIAFIGVGGVSLFFALFFTVKQTFRPRLLAQNKYLSYKEE